LKGLDKADLEVILCAGITGGDWLQSAAGGGGHFGEKAGLSGLNWWIELFRMKNIVRISAGIVFIILGLLGLVLPVLQGLLFLAIGLVLLAPDIPLFHKMFCWVEIHYPKTRETFHKVRLFTERLGKSVPPCMPDDE
jgi:uncharacterized protein